MWYQPTDVLTDTVLSALSTFETRVEEIATSDGKTYTDLCEKAYPATNAPCLKYSVLDYYKGNLPAAITAGSLKSSLTASASSLAGLPIMEASVLGLVKRDETGAVLRAKTLRTAWTLANDEVQAGEQAAVKDWELRFEKAALKFQEENIGGSFTFSTTDSLELELSAALKDSMILGIFGTMLILVFLVWIFSDITNGVRSSSSLAVGGVICILLSMGAGVGLALYCGVKYTPLTMIILF
jgi:hypothetical protein